MTRPWRSARRRQTAPPQSRSQPVSGNGDDGPRSTLRSASPSGWHLSTSPREELLDALDALDPTEVNEVLTHAKRTLAARHAAIDPDLITEILITLERHRVAFRSAPGVPVSLLRAGLGQPRGVLDRALFEAEAQGLLRLLPAKLHGAFIERAAGLAHRERGLLYYCAPPIEVRRG